MWVKNKKKYMIRCFRPKQRRLRWASPVSDRRSWLKARGIIEKAGYAITFLTVSGMGSGFRPWIPSMSHNNDELLKQGMVYTIEPGIYVPEIGVVRIEDDVLVTADGAKRWQSIQKSWLSFHKKRNPRPRAGSFLCWRESFVLLPASILWNEKNRQRNGMVWSRVFL